MPNLGIPPCLILLDTGNTSSITMWCDRRDMNDGPLSFAIKYVSNLNTPLGKPVTYIERERERERDRQRERVKMTRAVPDSLQLLSVDTT